MHAGRYLTYAVDACAVVGLMYPVFRPFSKSKKMVVMGSSLYLVAVGLLSCWMYSLGPYLDIHHPATFQLLTNAVQPVTGVIALSGVVLLTVGVVRDWRNSREERSQRLSRENQADVGGSE